MTKPREVQLLQTGPQAFPSLTCYQNQHAHDREVFSRAHQTVHDQLLLHLQAAIEEHAAPGCERAMLLMNLYASIAALFLAAGESQAVELGRGTCWIDLTNKHLEMNCRMYAEIRAREAADEAPPT